MGGWEGVREGWEGAQSKGEYVELQELLSEGDVGVDREVGEESIIL